MVSTLQLLYSLALAIPIIYLFIGYYSKPNKPDTHITNTGTQQDLGGTSEAEMSVSEEKTEKKPIMQPENPDLAPPKDDPFTPEKLREYDGSDPSKPIYVAIKGTVFDVTRKSEMYGPGKSYNIFAGKDGSKGLGKSSLKVEDAVPDYRDLSEEEMATLTHWYDFFSKRYNVVGKVVETQSNL